MAISTLTDLFQHTLADVHYAENRLARALPALAERATNDELKQFLVAHETETKAHASTLGKVFETLGLKAESERCAAMDGILKETEELVAECDDAETRDAAIISAMQAAKHYEITRYGTLCTWAGRLGKQDAKELLQENLRMDKFADEQLSQIAELEVNAAAVG